MKNDPIDRKNQLRKDLLQAMDDRNVTLRRRRRVAAPLLVVVVVGMMSLLIPSTPNSTTRVPVRVNWIPSVSMNHLVESNRVELVIGASHVQPCLPGIGATAVSSPGKTIARLSSTSPVQRINDAEAAALLQQVTKQSL
ncbi:MAG: hypothetical protein MK116_02320 [Phycisphaerales bacterium]|nr:hypothetical protein [Phycisphaerales bacterium]